MDGPWAGLEDHHPPGNGGDASHTRFRVRIPQLEFSSEGIAPVRVEIEEDGEPMEHPGNRLQAEVAMNGLESSGRKYMEPSRFMRRIRLEIRLQPVAPRIDQVLENVRQQHGVDARDALFIPIEGFGAPSSTQLSGKS